MYFLSFPATRHISRNSSDCWKEIINFDALVSHGMISHEDLNLFHYADDPPTALDLLKAALATEGEETAPCGSSQLDPREFVGGIDGLSVACGACGCRPANPSWRPQAANLEPSPRCCWRGSPCVIKSPCWSAAEPPVLSPLGSAVLDLVLALVAPLENRSRSAKSWYFPNRNAY
jgi:hypothetical protein